jgi:hypothetical protein
MVLDGLLTNAKLGGNLFVQITLGYVVEDFCLSGCQSRYHGSGIFLPG